MVYPNIRQFKQLLESFSIKYKSHEESYLTELGENYGSIILKIEVICEDNKKLNLVVKLCPTNEILKKAFLTNITFKKEILAYSNLIPAIQVFEIENNIEEPLEIFAKCYGARLNLNNNTDIDNDAAIVLDNLKFQGYVMEDRFHGFDKEQSLMIIKNLAKLHATVIAMKLISNKNYKENVIPVLKNINSGSTMIEGFINTAIHFVKTIKDLEPFIDKLEVYLNKRKRFGGLLFPYESNTNFYTIVHTDLWLNNIMVRKVKDKTTNIKIIDLQLLECGSPIRDLLFFIFSSVQIDLIEKNLEKFINMYYNEFNFTLLQFGCDLQNYSYKIFYQELNDVAPHELFHIIFMLKPIFSEKGSIDSLDNISADDFGRIDNIGKAYLDRLRMTVLLFVKNKWL